MKQQSNIRAVAGLAVKRVLLLCLVGAGVPAGVSGCRTFSLRPPAGYVRYERSRQYYRALSPDNSVIVVSSRRNRPKGDLNFWVETLKRDFTSVRGYKFLREADVKTADGTQGKSLWFEGSHQGRMYTYQVAIFVAKSRIFSVETATETESLERHEKAFDAAVSSLKIL